MRIGINALFQASGGSLTNLIQLIEQWQSVGAFREHQFIIFASRATHERLRHVLPPEAQTVVFPLADRNLLGRMIVEQCILPFQASKCRLDVLFCPANTAPFCGRVPQVVSFQNAAPFSSDVTLRTTGFIQFCRWYLLGRMMVVAARRAERIIFISKYFRDLFERRYGIDARKGEIVYRACREMRPADGEAPRIEAQYGIRRPYLLTVSHIHPYKNILQLIEAYAVALQAGLPAATQLVIAGGVTFFPRYFTQVQRRLASLPLGRSQILLTGDVPHADVTALLAGCQAFVFTSTCENCPTALIEALAAGKPIACSNVGVMPEILGEAGLYFDPYDVQEMARVLNRLCHDAELRRDLQARSRARARQFDSPRESARRTLAAIGSVVADRHVKRAA